MKLMPFIAVCFAGLLMTMGPGSFLPDLEAHPRRTLSGVVEPGPYEVGADVVLTELTDSLEELNTKYITRVRDSLGRYETRVDSLVTNKLLAETRGKYLNLFSGEMSDRDVFLECIARVRDEPGINVNILTHLERPRVEYLVQDGGLPFDMAKAQAQKEVLNIFGFDVDDMPPSEKISILDDTEAGAVLLALTGIFTAGRDAFTLQYYIDRFAGETRRAGMLSDEALLRELVTPQLKYEGYKVLEVLTAFYSRHDDDIRMPDYMHYIEQFLTHVGVPPEVNAAAHHRISATEVKLSGEIMHRNAADVVFYLAERGGDTLKTRVGLEPSLSAVPAELQVSFDGLQPATRYIYQVVANTENFESPGKGGSFVTDIDFDTRRYHFGYLVGYNQIGFSVSSQEPLGEYGFNEITTTNAPGFHAGLLLNVRISQRLDLRFLPTLMFAEERYVVYHDAETEHWFNHHRLDQSLGVTRVEVPMHIKYSFAEFSRKTPYVLTGMRYTYDFAATGGQNPSGGDILRLRTDPNDLHVDLGAGIDIAFRRFQISLGFIRSIGIHDLAQDGDEKQPAAFRDAVKSLKSRGWMLSLTVE